MPIGLSEQEVATILEIDNIFVCQRLRSQFDKNSGVFYLSEISSGPVVWGLLRYLF